LFKARLTGMACQPRNAPQVMFLLASRAWRALPPVRRRLAARPSNTPG
jgi:hypothetical protein